MKKTTLWPRDPLWEPILLEWPHNALTQLLPRIFLVQITRKNIYFAAICSDMDSPLWSDSTTPFKPLLRQPLHLISFQTLHYYSQYVSFPLCKVHFMICNLRGQPWKSSSHALRRSQVTYIILSFAAPQTTFSWACAFGNHSIFAYFTTPYAWKAYKNSGFAQL